MYDAVRRLSQVCRPIVALLQAIVNEPTKDLPIVSLHCSITFAFTSPSPFHVICKVSMALVIGDDTKASGKGAPRESSRDHAECAVEAWDFPRGVRSASGPC